MSECEFCKIARGEEAARIVCFTPDCLAFFPLKPTALGHTLVIPKKHVSDLWSPEIDPNLRAGLMTAVVKVGRAINNALRPQGMNLISSAGAAASQTVFHLHLHLVPRWPNDHIGNLWPPSEPWDEEVKDEVAELVREACVEPS